MSNRPMAGVLGKSAVGARTPWAAEDVFLLMLLPYLLTLGVLLLCGPVMFVAWGVSAVVARLN